MMNMAAMEDIQEAFKESMVESNLNFKSLIDLML